MTTTPKESQQSQPYWSPAMMGPGNDDNKTKRYQEEDDQEYKPCLSPRKRAYIILGCIFVIFLIVWQLKPFERIINAVLPQLNDTQQADRTESPINPATTRDTFPFQQCHNNSSECCNGLDNICHLSINDVLFATAHSAMTTKEDGSFLHPNHLYSLEAAIQAGYRGLHLQVCNCDGEYELCNGVCHLGARNPAEVFMNIHRFLNDNSNEVMIITLHLNSEIDRTIDIHEFYNEIMMYATFSKNMFVLTERDDEWPTLSDMIRLDKRVILFHYGGPTCDNNDCPTGMHYWYRYAKETEDQLSHLSQLKNNTRSCAVYQSPTIVNDTITPKLFAVNNFLDIPNINVSRIVNSLDFLTQRIKACSDSINGMPANMVSVDFWHEGNAIEFVQRQNRERGLENNYIAV